MSIISGFHGTNQEFDKFDQSKAKISNDYYGGGIAYFTPDINIAKIYAKTAVKKSGGEEIIYRVQMNFHKIFDVDQEYTGTELKNMVGNSVENFARAAGLLNLGADKYTVVNQLKTGAISMTGAQIFRGMSGGMINTAKAREQLKRLKFDALRYTPVAHAQRTKHDVYIAYDARNVRITGRIGTPQYDS